SLRFGQLENRDMREELRIKVPVELERPDAGGSYERLPVERENAAARKAFEHLRCELRTKQGANVQPPYAGEQSVDRDVGPPRIAHGIHAHRPALAVVGERERSRRRGGAPRDWKPDLDEPRQEIRPMLGGALCHDDGAV